MYSWNYSEVHGREKGFSLTNGRGGHEPKWSLTRGAGPLLIPSFPTAPEPKRYKNGPVFSFAVHPQFPLGFRLPFPLRLRAWLMMTARVSRSRFRVPQRSLSSL